MLTAYSYIRWSSQIQTKGDSLSRQLEKTRAFCNENGWTLDESLQPQILSAFTGKNLEEGPLYQFKEDVLSGRIKTPCVLVVEAVDRLSRDHWDDSRQFFEELIRAGVTVASWVSRRIYSPEELRKNPMMLMLFLMELEAAHNYSENLSQRLQSAWKKKKLDAVNGKLLTRKVPAWIEIPKSKEKKSPPDCFKIIKGKAAIVKRIYKDYLDGKGVDTIIQNLNKEGKETFTPRAKAWSVTTVRRLIRTETVIGNYVSERHVGKNVRKRQPDGLKIDGYYPSIISKKLFFDVQDEIKRRTTHKGSHKKVINLFTGLVKCKHCGWAMNLKVGGSSKTDNQLPTWSALVCSQAMRGRGCKYRTFRLEPLENAIITRQLSFWMQLFYAPETTKNEKKVKLRLKEVSNALSNFEKSLDGTDGNIPVMLIKKMDELEKEKTSLEREMSTAPMIHDDYITPMEEIARGEKKPMLRDVKNRNWMRTAIPRLIKEILIDTKKDTAEVVYNYLDPKHMKKGSDEFKKVLEVATETGKESEEMKQFYSREIFSFPKDLDAVGLPYFTYDNIQQEYLNHLWWLTPHQMKNYHD